MKILKNFKNFEKKKKNQKKKSILKKKKKKFQKKNFTTLLFFTKKKKKIISFFKNFSKIISKNCNHVILHFNITIFEERDKSIKAIFVLNNYHNGNNLIIITIS